MSVCWPGFKVDRLKGVTHDESLLPSICTCAPAGVEVTLNCPATMAGSTGRALAFFLGAYFGCTETACGAASGAEATCTGVCTVGGACGGWAEAVAAGCAGVTSSSAFSE